MADRIFVFMPTLTHLALVKIAIPLYNEFGIARMNRAFNRIELRNSTKIGQDAENPELLRYHRAVQNLLLIPPRLRKRLLEAVHGLHHGIWKWICDYHKILKAKEKFSVIYWRFDGTIDRMKTARQLVENANIDISQRFNLACTFCMEESIQTLWAEMVASGEADNFIIDSNAMAGFWIKWMREGSRVPWTQAARLQAFRKYLYPSAGAFWPRVSCILPLLLPEERKQLLPSLKFARNDDLRFCLCAITKEEEEQVLQECSLDVLCLFLKWPFRSLFSATAEKLLKNLDGSSFRVLICSIVGSKCDWKNFDYFEVLEDFWNIVPNHLKEKAEEWPRVDQIASFFDDLRNMKKPLIKN